MSGWQIMAGLGTACLGAAVLALSLAVTRRRRQPGDGVLAAPRWLLVCGVGGAVLLALRPERQANATSRPGRAVLLQDASGSMTTAAGAMGKERRCDIAQAVARDLRQRLGRNGAPVERSFGAPVGTAGGTNLHEAISTALAGAPVAIVLLSDGDVNAGPDPRLAARAAAEAGVPVFTVCLGRPEPVPTLGITDCLVPERCLLGDLAVVTARLASTLPLAWEGEIELSAATQRVASRRVRLEPGQSCFVSLRWRPDRPGPHDLALRLPVPPQDPIPDDNQRTALVLVDAEPLHVLAVDRQPRWEFRHAVAALRAEPTMHVQTLLLDPLLRPDDSLPEDLRGEDIATEDSGADRLRALPGRAELGRYDVVLLGAVPCGEGGVGLSEPAAADLHRAVAETGTGLILLPGAGAGATAWAKGPLAPLLPVQPGPDAVDTVVRCRTPGALRLMPDARFSALTALGDDPDDDARAWRELPGLQRYSRCGEARPGSALLVTLSDASGVRPDVPLLVSWTAGLGRVLYIGSDQLWRWRGPGSDGVHERLWQAAVRSVARRAGAQGASPWRVLVEGGPAVVGSPVVLHAIPTGDRPVGAGTSLACALRQQQGLEVRLVLSGVAPGQTALSGQVALPAAGVWEVWPEGAPRAAASVAVLDAPAEASGAPARPEVLDALAALSGGQRFEATASDALAEAVAASRGPATATPRQRPWAHPAGVAMVLLLTGLGLAVQELKAAAPR